MKKIPILALMAVSWNTQASQVALPGYRCLSMDGTQELSLFAPPHARAYVLLVKSPAGDLDLVAVPGGHDHGPIFSQETFSVYGPDQLKGKFVITSIPMMGAGGCGRAGCDFASKLYTGKLVLHEVETTFTCDKTL